MVKSDFTFELGKGQEEDETLKFGVTEVTDQLFLGGEEDVSDVLDEVDLWVDLRDDGPFNRVVEIPRHVVYVRIPIKDGDSERAAPVFKKAKQLVDASIAAGEKVLVSCHAGFSRSALLAWWVLSEQTGDPESAWCSLKSKRHWIEPHENFWPFIEEYVLKDKAEKDAVVKEARSLED